MKYRNTILIIILLTLSCQKREWTNPFDPDCPKGIFTPSDFSATQQGNSIRLTWNQVNKHISGYRIYRNSNDGDWFPLGEFSEEILAYTDNNIDCGKKYSYKLIATAGTNSSNEKTTSLSPILGAVLTTSQVTSITSTSAISGGNVTCDGGAPVTDRGICFGTTQSPTVSNNKISSGTGAGSFAANMSGLLPGTTYYIRAFATNSTGISYGNQVSFITATSTPVVTTDNVTVFNSNSAVVGGNVTSDGGLTVTEKGICYSTTTNPTTGNSKVIMGSGSGTFSSTVTNLTTNTTYFVRGYAINNKGTSYGNQVSFKTDNPLVDADGNTYKTVIIGNQIWMSENLAYLPSVNPPTVESSANPVYYVYGYYGSDINSAKSLTNYKNYGVLYNWPAAMQGSASSTNVPSGVKGICPTGWHLPSESEWIILSIFLGGNNLAGGKMKSVTGWNAPNIGATNESGFTGLPGGNRSLGVFTTLGDYGSYWSSCQADNSAGKACGLFTGNSNLTFGSTYKADAFYVRCLKD